MPDIPNTLLNDVRKSLIRINEYVEDIQALVEDIERLLS